MNTPITRLHILDQDSPADRINVTVSRIARNFGAFHDASAYFGLFPLLAERGNKKQYEVRRVARCVLALLYHFYIAIYCCELQVYLAKSLLEKFQAGDQFNLQIEANDGDYTVTHEVYGRIEAARDPSRGAGKGPGRTTNPPTSPTTTTQRSTAPPSPTPHQPPAHPPDKQNRGVQVYIYAIPVFLFVGLSGLVAGIHTVVVFSQHLKKIIRILKRPVGTVPYNCVLCGSLLLATLQGTLSWWRGGEGGGAAGSGAAAGGPGRTRPLQQHRVHRTAQQEIKPGQQQLLQK